MRRGSTTVRLKDAFFEYYELYEVVHWQENINVLSQSTFIRDPGILMTTRHCRKQASEHENREHIPTLGTLQCRDKFTSQSMRVFCRYLTPNGRGFAFYQTPQHLVPKLPERDWRSPRKARTDTVLPRDFLVVLTNHNILQSSLFSNFATAVASQTKNHHDWPRHAYPSFAISLADLAAHREDVKI